MKLRKKKTGKIFYAFIMFSDLILLIILAIIAMVNIYSIIHELSEEAEKAYDRASSSYNNSTPTKENNSCPIIGGKACIVDEWQPICLIKECIIDSRE